MIVITDEKEELIRQLLRIVGEDPDREGLKETPARVLRAWGQATYGYLMTEAHIDDLLRTFEDGSERVDELIMVKDIPIYSNCEHHMLPMFGVAHIGYIPSGKILGLSKFVRLTDAFAYRLQVQERLTQQIANALFNSHLKPVGVGVVLSLRHLCMEQRGVCTIGTTTHTSCMLGVLREKPEARAEFLSLTRK